MPNDIDNEAVAERLAFIREELGMSQRQFAAYIGAQPALVNHWETARQRLSLNGARTIRELTGYDLEFLYFGVLSGLSIENARRWNEWRQKKSST